MIIGLPRPFWRTGKRENQMRTRITSLLFIAVASAVLASCAQPGFKPSDTTNRCAGPECEIPVTVNSIGDSCQPGPVADIDATADGPHKITWKMITPGFEFSGTPVKFAIFIKEDPDDDFSNAVVPGNGQTVTIMFNHKHPRKNYRYGVNVRRSTGDKPFCEPLDPWLIS
ncbi:MAG: hypothetical protein E6H71_13985 [Betaproteobacteria bacterium]|nr:MAG: hypothetical protein E6H71_13985 [Betaproteobacteria bacterium]